MNSQELSEARGWIADTWGSVGRLSDEQVLAVVRRNYEGGLPQFRRDVAVLVQPGT